MEKNEANLSSNEKDTLLKLKTERRINKHIPLSLLIYHYLFF